MSEDDWCRLAHDWKLDARFAEKIVRFMEQFSFQTSFGIEVISGYRTREEQEQLRREGRPVAPDNLSTHRSCPATGADFRISMLGVTRDVKIEFGHIAHLSGLRWGGGSKLDDQGMPIDWNHLDLGPRN